jgi:hypothetical protein
LQLGQRAEEASRTLFVMLFPALRGHLFLWAVLFWV